MDILELLTKHGIEVSEDKIEALDKDLRTNFKTKYEVDRLRDNISELENTIKVKEDEIQQINTDTEQGMLDLKNKLAERSEIESKYNQLVEQNTELALSNKALELNVDPQFSEFVVNKAKTLANDELSAEEALTSYLSENQQFIQTKTEPKSTSPSFSGENSKSLSINDALFNTLEE